MRRPILRNCMRGTRSRWPRTLGSKTWGSNSLEALKTGFAASFGAVSSGWSGWFDNTIRVTGFSAKDCCARAVIRGWLQGLLAVTGRGSDATACMIFDAGCGTKFDTKRACLDIYLLTRHILAGFDAKRGIRHLSSDQTHPRGFTTKTLYLLASSFQGSTGLAFLPVQQPV